MLRPLALLHIAERLPFLFRGPALHRAGLRALAGGEVALADRLFERAALAYRREIAIEPLARVRVHQLMARCRAGSAPDPESRAVLEVERRLQCLPAIESLEAPFELIAAHRLLASWLDSDLEGELPARRAA